MMMNKIGFTPRLTKKIDNAKLPDIKTSKIKLPKESNYDKIVKIVEGDNNDLSVTKENQERNFDHKLRFKIAH
jgi:hypothetical protein